MAEPRTNPGPDELDELLERASASAITQLGAAIDVDQRLRDLYADLGLVAPDHADPR